MTVIAVAVAAIVLRVALLWAIPVPVPRIHDEFSYLLIADTFVHGRLANPPHPMWLFFDSGNVLQHPTYASIFPPAQGAALALGQLLGTPWIGVLLSMAAMCAAVTWALQGWVPARWALLGAVLVLLRVHLCSPWLESYWGGGVAALGGALVLGAVPRLVRRPRASYAVAMGVGVALLANSRPLEGALFCVPIMVAIAAWLLSKRSPSLRITVLRVILPLGCILGVTLWFIAYYNWRVTGNALELPHMLYQREYINYPVFIWQSPGLPLHYSNPQLDDLFNGWVRHTFRRSWQLEWKTCRDLWAFFLGGSLSIPLITLPWLVRDRRTRFLLIQFAFCALGLLSVYYFEPHYAAPLTATIFALLIQAMRHLRRWEIKGRPVGIFLTRLVVLLALARVAVLVGEAARNPATPWWSLDRARIVKELDATLGRHLVIVHYEPDHFFDREWVYNGADIDGSKVVWAREIPGVNPEPLLEYFKDRKVWIVNADEQPARLQPFQKPSVPTEAAPPGEPPLKRKPEVQSPGQP